MHRDKKNVWFLGVPNSGKTSIFNLLTNLSEKTGNYPGITTDKKQAILLTPEHEILLSDLPGLYSVFPNSAEEDVTLNLLLTQNADKIYVVIDATKLKKSLYLLSQLLDMGLPCVGILNMTDLMSEVEAQTLSKKLNENLGIEIISFSAKKKKNLDVLQANLINFKEPINTSSLCFNDYADKLSLEEGEENFMQFVCGKRDETLSQEEKSKRKNSTQKDSIHRHKYIRELLLKIDEKEIYKNITPKIDKFLLHPVFGYCFFLVILLFIFHALFTWSVPLIDAVDWVFYTGAEWMSAQLPDGLATSLLVDGVWSGLGGVLVFVPQIFILFLLLGILEEFGYLSRLVCILDKPMSKFGLHGKSIVPMLSGLACAIPGIMSARNIENKKERWITIFITPFMTCSARLPVYAILISLVIPNKIVGGVFQLQALTLLALYLLGVVFALFTAFIMKYLIKQKNKTAFVLEIPDYRLPIPRNIFRHAFSKSKSFLLGAGKIILILSVFLWFLGKHGVKDEQIFAQQTLEESYLADIGKGIVPVIEPLGYDWKIGIALISSLAAREVFIGTLATLYSIDDNVEEHKLIEKMKIDVNANTGEKLYTPAVGISLLVFYALALQCFSTVATTRMETKTWKFPIIQLLYMTLLAYGSAYFVYKLII